MLTVTVEAARADDCGFALCPNTGLNGGSVDVAYNGSAVARLVGSTPAEQQDYAWRLVTPCVVSDDTAGVCSSSDFRVCPQEPGRVVEYLVVQRRPVVRFDGTAIVDVPDGLQPGDLLDSWESVRDGCIDITALNPPPSPAEVFSYFERLPLPELTAQHQPPGNGLSGLPVIFYTDEATTETFTVNISPGSPDLQRFGPITL